MKSMLGRVLQTLLILALAVPQGALAQQVLYRCHMDGKVHRSCCCEDEASSASASFECSGCCSIETIDNGLPPAISQREALKFSRAALSGVLAPTLALVHTLEAAPSIERESGPPRFGPRIFLEFCSFLI